MRGGPRGGQLSNEDCLVLDLIPVVEVDGLPLLETTITVRSVSEPHTAGTHACTKDSIMIFQNLKEAKRIENNVTHGSVRYFESIGPLLRFSNVFSYRYCQLH